MGLRLKGCPGRGEIIDIDDFSLWIKRSSDDIGYIIDIYKKNTDKLIDTFTLWDYDIEDIEDEEV